MYKQRLKRKHFRKQGVPQGYKHSWYYGGGRWNEIKGRNNTWKFSYSSSKSRGGSSRGGPPVGYKVMWGIRAIQRAVKVSPRRYQTVMIGQKKLLGYYDPRTKMWKRNYRRGGYY